MQIKRKYKNKYRSTFIPCTSVPKPSKWAESHGGLPLKIGKFSLNFNRWKIQRGNIYLKNLKNFLENPKIFILKHPKMKFINRKMFASYPAQKASLTPLMTRRRMARARA